MTESLRQTCPNPPPQPPIIPTTTHTRICKPFVYRPSQNSPMATLTLSRLRPRAPLLLLSRPLLASSPARRPFTSTPPRPATFNQVLRGIRGAQPPRRKRSPALKNRPQMKGVCLRVGTMEPKKPNSGMRKVARVRLSNGVVVNCYVPGEGELGLVFFFLSRGAWGADGGGQGIICRSTRSCWRGGGRCRIVRA